MEQHSTQNKLILESLKQQGEQTMLLIQALLAKKKKSNE
jgi:hypothetical protein